MTDEFRTSIASANSGTARQDWSAAKRVIFRFCFAYLGLYCFALILPQILMFPKLDVPDPFTLWPFRPAIFWVAAHLFGAKLPLVYNGSGSGDKTWDWTETLCILAVALVATAVWSALDRERTNYATLDKWLRLGMRFCLGATILLYLCLRQDRSAANALSGPDLTATAVFGIFARGYSVELHRHISGLRDLRRTRGAAGRSAADVSANDYAGGLICLADMTQVWMLNMTYDVPVKLFSFHLGLLSLFLLAPQTPRLFDFFVRGRAVQAEKIAPLFQSRRANRVAIWVQAILWIWILSMNTYQSAQSWRTYGGGRAKSGFYGIWDVTQMTVDGQLRAPLLSDNGRWRRMIFDFPETATAQHLDDSFERLQATIDATKKTLTLAKRDDKNWKASFTFQRLAADQLELNGTIAGHPAQMQLKRVDEKKFLLASRGFHWVQEYPVIR